MYSVMPPADSCSAACACNMDSCLPDQIEPTMFQRKMPTAAQNAACATIMLRINGNAASLNTASPKYIARTSQIHFSTSAAYTARAMRRVGATPSAYKRHANSALPIAIVPPPNQAAVPDCQSRAQNPKPTNP